MSLCRAELWRACGFALALAAAPSIAQEPIAVDPLGDVAPFAVGALRDDELPLSQELWRNSDARVVRALIDAAPAESLSLAAARLSARVLLSQGQTPVGQETADNMARSRVMAAERAGRLDAVDQIVSASIGADADREMLNRAIAARLALGRVDEACAPLTGGDAGEAGAFRLRARAACMALNGEAAAADVTFRLGQERGAEAMDERFGFWLAAIGDPSSAPSVPPRDEIELALSGAALIPVPPNSIDALPLSMVAAIALDERRRGPGRIFAARRAARAGAISAQDYAAALEALAPPSDRDPETVLEAAYAAEGVMQTALMHAVARSTAPAERRAEAIVAVIETAEHVSDFALAGEMYADDLATLPLNLETAPHGASFAEAAAAAGRPDIARRWLETRTGGRTGPATLTDVQPETAGPPLDRIETSAMNAIITASDPDVDGGALLAAARGRLEAVGEASPFDIAAAERDAMLLLALGATNTPDIRAAAARAAVSEPALSIEVLASLYAMEVAADADALGEAALFASRALAAAGPESALASARVARVLWRLGLDEDARSVIVQSILAGRRGE